MVMYGYHRVSTKDQNPQLQIDALTKYGCERLFGDVGVSGMKVSRPGLDDVLDRMREGDTLVVWKLDRLGRSPLHLLSLVDQFLRNGWNLVSLTQNVDTSTPIGKAIFTFSTLLAELERDLIVERTRAGLAAARAQGKVGGRPKSLQPADDRMIMTLFSEGEYVADIAAKFGVSESTVFRSLRRSRAKR